MYSIPSVPSTNPTRFALIIIKILPTAPSAQMCLYQGRPPNCTIDDCSLEET